jgi:hypothetical protein
METLTIEIPKGHVIDSFDQSTGVIKFKEKPKNVIERIKTIDDVLAEHGFTMQEFKNNFAKLDEDEKAYKLLKMLATTLNEGWLPDWNNRNQPKYFAWFEMGGSSGFRFHVYDHWRSASDVGSRLCFKSRELAEHAGKQFTEVYKQFMTI